MTQQNAALVEEATAASKSMADQSQALSDVMSKFQVASQPARSPAPARAPLRAPLRKPIRPNSLHKPKAAPAAARPKAAVGDDSAWKQF
jgi:hypothetical protein